MSEMIVELVAAFFGSLGFAILFRLRKELLTLASFGGMFAWLVFLLVQNGTDKIFVPCLCGAIFAGFYAELLAHVLRAPVILFFIVAVVPLIPGSCLYYTTERVVARDYIAASHFWTLTMTYALAISLGIAMTWAVIIMHSNVKNKVNKK